jgi:NitT/TauT family transport system permease protein
MAEVPSARSTTELRQVRSRAMAAPADVLRKHLESHSHNYLAAGTIVLLLLVWELTNTLGLVHRIVLPPPSEVARSLWNLMTSDYFLKNFRVTLIEIFIGFALGLFLGLVFGTLLAIIPPIRQILYPYIVAFQALPKIVFAPLFVTWFGFGMESKIATAVAICFFPVFINTMVGLQLVSEESLKLMRSLRANEWQIFAKLRFPNALPHIFAGIQTSLTFAMTGAIAAEFITGAADGMGRLAQIFGLQLETGLQFGVVVIVSALGLVAVTIADWIDRKVVFWREDTTTKLRRGELSSERPAL